MHIIEKSTYMHTILNKKDFNSQDLKIKTKHTHTQKHKISH